MSVAVMSAAVRYCEPSSLPALERGAQGSDEVTYSATTRYGKAICFQIAQSNSQFQLGFEFRNRATSDAYEVQQFPCRTSSRTFRDVGWHGDRGSPHLGR
jgi:hypothetical protein